MSMPSDIPNLLRFCSPRNLRLENLPVIDIHWHHWRCKSWESLHPNIVNNASKDFHFVTVKRGLIRRQNGPSVKKLLSAQFKMHSAIRHDDKTVA
ncbi:MAG TPA: hypothetical protein VEV41_21605 [Terriglobales bacterium]|nr:hypothetical protein [Terriglobales bacterium]